MTTTAEGRCLCGAYHYQFDREQVVSAHHCHCKDCQKSIEPNVFCTKKQKGICTKCCQMNP